MAEKSHSYLNIPLWHTLVINYPMTQWGTYFPYSSCETFVFHCFLLSLLLQVACFYKTIHYLLNMNTVNYDFKRHIQMKKYCSVSVMVGLFVRTRSGKNGANYEFDEEPHKVFYPVNRQLYLYPILSPKQWCTFICGCRMTVPLCVSYSSEGKEIWDVDKLILYLYHHVALPSPFLWPCCLPFHSFAFLCISAIIPAIYTKDTHTVSIVTHILSIF